MKNNGERNTDAMLPVATCQIGQTQTGARQTFAADDRQPAGRLDDVEFEMVGGSCFASNQTTPKKHQTHHEAVKEPVPEHNTNSMTKQCHQLPTVRLKDSVTGPIHVKENPHKPKRKLKVRQTKKTKAQIQSNKEKLKEKEVDEGYSDEITRAYDRINRLHTSPGESVSTVPASTPSTVRSSRGVLNYRDNRNRKCESSDVGRKSIIKKEQSKVDCKDHRGYSTPSGQEPTVTYDNNKQAVRQPYRTRRRHADDVDRTTSPVTTAPVPARISHTPKQNKSGNKMSDPGLKAQQQKSPTLAIKSCASTLYDKSKSSWCSRFAVNRSIAAAFDPGFTFHAKDSRHETPSELSLWTASRMNSDQLVLYGSATPSEFSTTSSTATRSVATRLESSPPRSVLCDRCYTTTPGLETPGSSSGSSCIPNRHIRSTYNHSESTTRNTRGSRNNGVLGHDVKDRRCAVTNLSFTSRDSLSANPAARHVFKASSVSEMSSGRTRCSATASQKSQRSSASTIKSVCSTANGSSRRSSASKGTKTPPWRY